MSGKPKTPEFLRRFVADETLIEHIVQLEASFPCYALEVDDMFAEGDRVAIRTTLKGTHGGEFRGAAPTGRDVAVPALVHYRVSGGRIVDAWLGVDTLALMEQIGALPVTPSVSQWRSPSRPRRNACETSRP